MLDASFQLPRLATLKPWQAVVIGTSQAIGNAGTIDNATVSNLLVDVGGGAVTGPSGNSLTVTNGARVFFTDLAFAHRGDSRARNEERIRATAASLAETHDAAAGLTGALDLLEATLTLLTTVGKVRLKADATYVSDRDLGRGVRL